MYAEMAGRRSLVTEAIKKLVRHGILKVKIIRDISIKSQTMDWKYQTAFIVHMHRNTAGYQGFPQKNIVAK